MRKSDLEECGCVNPKACPDCHGSGYVKKGSILASDRIIAEHLAEQGFVGEDPAIRKAISDPAPYQKAATEMAAAARMQ